MLVQTLFYRQVGERLLSCLEQSLQQHFVHSAAESLFSINHYDRNTRVKPLTQGWVGIDVDSRRLQAVAFQQHGRVIAEVATAARVENHFRCRHEAPSMS